MFRVDRELLVDTSGLLTLFLALPSVHLESLREELSEQLHSKRLKTISAGENLLTDTK